MDTLTRIESELQNLRVQIERVYGTEDNPETVERDKTLLLQMGSRIRNLTQQWDHFGDNLEVRNAIEVLLQSISRMEERIHHTLAK